MKRIGFLLVAFSFVAFTSCKKEDSVSPVSKEIAAPNVVSGNGTKVILTWD